MQKISRRKIILAVALVSGVLVWVIGILLLLEVTRQLLEVVRFIIELAQLG